MKLIFSKNLNAKNMKDFMSINNMTSTMSGTLQILKRQNMLNIVFVHLKPGDINYIHYFSCVVLKD